MEDVQKNVQCFSVIRFHQWNSVEDFVGTQTNVATTVALRSQMDGNLRKHKQ